MIQDLRHAEALIMVKLTHFQTSTLFPVSTWSLNFETKESQDLSIIGDIYGDRAVFIQIAKNQQLHTFLT